MNLHEPNFLIFLFLLDFVPGVLRVPYVTSKLRFLRLLLYIEIGGFIQDRQVRADVIIIHVARNVQRDQDFENVQRHAKDSPKKI